MTVAHSRPLPTVRPPRGIEEHPGAGWVQLPLSWLHQHNRSAASDADRLTSGLLMLICGDVIRPGMAWMLTRTHRYLASTMAQTRDPDGFARLDHLAATGPAGARLDAQIAATKVATVLACKGGGVTQITVGDCVELVDTQRRVHVRGGQKTVDFYLRLRALGIFPPDAPATIRAFGLAGGQLSIEELVDRYRLRCMPIRDLLVAYLRERQPALDYASLRDLPHPGRTVLGQDRSPGAGHRHDPSPAAGRPPVEARPGHQDTHYHRTGWATGRGL
jgi:hypothetical protein